MAQSDAMGDILKIGAVAVGGWLLWSWYESTLPAATTSAGTSTMGTTTPSTVTTPPAAPAAPTVTLVIPQNLLVTPVINNGLQATVVINGSNAVIAVIPANAGQTSGVVYNSSGTDITSMFSPTQVQQLVSAFSLAPQLGTRAGATAAAPSSTNQAAGVNRRGLSAFGFGQVAPNYVRAGSPMTRPHNYLRRTW